MRRTRILLLCLSMVAATLAGPARPAGADHGDAHVVANAIGEIVTSQPIPITGRTTGTGSFRALTAHLTVVDGDGTVFVFPSIQQAPGHTVEFTTDDDLSDGTGNVLETDDSRAFYGEGVRADDPNHRECAVARIFMNGWARAGSIIVGVWRTDVRLARHGADGVCFTADDVARWHKTTRLLVKITLIPVPPAFIALVESEGESPHPMG